MAVVAALGAGCGGTHPTQSAPLSPAPTLRAPTPTVLPRVAPVGVDIPTIDAHSSLIPLGLNADGSIKVPEVHHPQQASYYCVEDKTHPERICSSGVVPGQVGPAVIVGHVDGAHQKGIFYRLKEVQVGDTVQVREANGSTLSFVVYRVLSAAKTQFPASVVYGDTTTPELRLITCTGNFVGGKLGYANNLIVFATLIPQVPA